jgi:hypothetical protein
MTKEDDLKTRGRRGFFQNGLNSLLRSVAEAQEAVADVADEVREVAREAMGDEPVESGGRTFYRDRRKRVVAKDHDALVAIRDALASEGIETRCVDLFKGSSQVEVAFSKYAETLKTYQGTMPEFEAVLTAREAFTMAVLKHGQAKTLAGAHETAAVYKNIAETTQDDAFKRLGIYLQGVAYFQETCASQLSEMATHDVPLHAKVRLELLATSVGGTAYSLLGLADEDDLLSLQEDLKMDGKIPGYLVADLSKQLVSRLMQAGRNANQAHRDAKSHITCAQQMFFSPGALPKGFEVHADFIVAVRHAYLLKAV